MKPRSTMLPPGASAVGAVEERLGTQPSMYLPAPTRRPIGFAPRQTLESADKTPSAVAPQLGRPSKSAASAEYDWSKDPWVKGETITVPTAKAIRAKAIRDKRLKSVYKDDTDTEGEGRGRRQKSLRAKLAEPPKGKGRPRSTTFHSEEEALAPPSNSAAAPKPKKTLEHPLITRHKGRPLTAVAENPPPPPKPAPKKSFNLHTQPKKEFIGHGLTRATLPKSREEYETLAETLRGQGHKIRINKNSTIANIRKNFIKKFSL